MVDSTPSSPLDDLFDPASTRGSDASNLPQATQHLSRRELRAAELAAQAKSVSAPVVPSIPVAPQGISDPAVFSVPVSTAPVMTPGRATRTVKTPRKASVKRSLTTAEVPIAASAPKESRRNPISMLATMVAVSGLFAVAAIPAYALQETEVATATSAKSTTDAQTIEVGADVAASVATRDGFRATTPEQLEQANEDAIRAAANEAYLASGARELGDDYPWPFELTDDEGGGLSPLNYYYRECVDFVAWRINRDQGYYAAPFKWVWSTLTPMGGNGSQWQSNWEALGRTVSNTPIVGAVAYTGGNHIAYVRDVNPDGTVTLEEYNYVPGMYSQRTIPASSVVSFLYPPS